MKPRAGATFTVEMWNIDRVVPYDQNPRLADEDAVRKTATSIKSFDWQQPFVVDEEGVIIAGHTRLLAARKLGLTQVPVHVARGLAPAQVKAYRLADNRTAQESSWNEALLSTEIAALLELNFDPVLCGFDGDEIAALLAEPVAGLTDPDEPADAPEEPVTQAGDLWLLGSHRLLCGDATNVGDVERLMNGERAALMATDPPYLVDYQGGQHPSSAANKGAATKDKHWDAYIDHQHSVEFYVDFLTTALQHALTDDAALYQCFGIMRTEVIWQAWREVGLLPHQVLIWKKTRAVLTCSHFMWDYEPMMYGWPEGHMPKMKPPADARAVWEIASTIEDDAAGLHPTQKPVELVRRPITYHTKPGGLIYEPFCGSGTALIAAEMGGRRCYALEQAPAFVDAAVARWERFTGKQAQRGH